MRQYTIWMLLLRYRLLDLDREIVWGMRKEPYIAVQRPEHYGQEAATTPWSWSDAISSWTWPGYDNKPIQVEVYSDAEEMFDGKVLAVIRSKA